MYRKSQGNWLTMIGRRIVTELLRIAKELVRAEIIAYRPGKNGYERVGPICLTAGNELDSLRRFLATSTNFGPNTFEQVCN